MSLVSAFENVGEYVLLMQRTLTLPDRFREFFKEFSKEVYKLGVNSIWLVMIISFFIGAVIVMQIGLNIDSPLLPRFTVGATSREIILLEFSSTIMCLILSGKVGSNIASEVGTMRVTEQIDALEVMGINAINYLVFPKFIALMLYPFLISIAMFLGILGGMAACVFGGFASLDDYIAGVQMDFIPFHMVYAFIKTFVFAFLLATIPSYYGYYMKGGALEVGKASTTSFVWTSVAIILLNYILTQMLLS